MTSIRKLNPVEEDILNALKKVPGRFDLAPFAWKSYAQSLNADDYFLSEDRTLLDYQKALDSNWSVDNLFLQFPSRWYKRGVEKFFKEVFGSNENVVIIVPTYTAADYFQLLLENCSCCCFPSKVRKGYWYSIFFFTYNTQIKRHFTNVFSKIGYTFSNKVR